MKPRRSAPRRMGQGLLTALVAAACAAPGEEGPRAPAGRFVEDVLIVGTVLENSTACEVDAVCYLRIEFADTSVVAVYGTGERPRPPCEMTPEVSDVAFRVRPTALVSVVISKCGAEGYYLREIAP